MLFISLTLILTTFSFLGFIDKRLNTILSGYIDSEVERVAYYVVEEVMRKIDYNKYDNLLNIIRNPDGSIENVSYNTIEINKLKNEILMLSKKEFLNIEKGQIDDNSFVQQQFGKNRYKHINKGYLCEVNFSSIRGSTLFGNVGASIPIKLSFMGYNSVDMDINIKEYGINNVMVELFIVLNLNSIVTMPLNSKNHSVIVREPISIELIKGNLPSYYFNNQ